MGRQNQSVGIINQGISRDSSLFLVSPGKAAVNDQHLSAAFYRILPVLGLDRHMAVDNMSLLGRQAELLQDAAHCILILQHGVIGILFFPVGLLVRQKIALKGSHLILSEQGRILMEPDIPAYIPAFCPLCRVHCHERLSHITVQTLIEAFALVVLPVYVHLFKAAVPV